MEILSPEKKGNLQIFFKKKFPSTTEIFGCDYISLHCKGGSDEKCKIRVTLHVIFEIIISCNIIILFSWKINTF